MKFTLGCVLQSRNVFFMNQHLVVLPIMDMMSAKLDVNGQKKKISLLLLCIRSIRNKPAAQAAGADPS